MYNKTMKLPNGVSIPVLALGTWRIKDDNVSEPVKEALKLGYRHIDTAQVYGNERGVGEAVKNCGIDRKELFITSKVAAEHKTYEEAALGIDNTLKIMGLDYLDMMLIHSPQPWKEVNQSEDRHIEGNRNAWKALEDAYESGKLRAIGISNFLREDIDSLWEAARIKPMVNQILCHISNTPFELIEYCKSKGIVVEAYSPIAHGEAMKNETILKMAKKYGVSIPRLCIRYDIQLGTVVLAKAANPEHIKDNSDLDFVISDEDMEILKNVEKIKDYGEHGFLPVFGGKL